MEVNLGAIRFNWKGAYAGGTAYVADDVVSSGGSSYICILASTGNAVSNATYWSQMSAAGTDGTDLTSTLTTQGDVLYRDGSGLQRLAKGTAAQVLSVNSGATAPEWADAAAGGAWTVIESTEASDTASITFTGINDTYSTYAITISDCVTAADGTQLNMRVGDSSGIDTTSGHYRFFAQYTEPSSSSWDGYGGSGNAEIQLCRGVGNATGEGVMGIIYLHQPSSGTTRAVFTGNMAFTYSSGVFKGGSFTAQHSEANFGIDRVQFFADGGNISQGRFTIYGISHA